MKKYTVTRENGAVTTVAGNHAIHAATLAAKHIYGGGIHVDAVDGAQHTRDAGTFRVSDSATGEEIEHLTVTRHIHARGEDGGRAVTHTRPRTVSLDDATVAALRAYGGGNLSLGIRRACALVGGGK